MKNLPALGCVILGVALSSCTTHPQSAVLAPARTSNAATQQHIKRVQSDIKLSQAKAAAGATALQKADANLNALLGAPRTNVKTVVTVVAEPTPTPTPTPTPAPKRSLFKRLFMPATPTPKPALP
jgi:hypothetical protein